MQERNRDTDKKSSGRRSLPMLQHPSLSSLGVRLKCKGTRSLRELVEEGNAEELSKRLARASTVEVNEKDRHGQTLLHYAVETQHDELVQLLVSHPSVNASVSDQSKRTALYLAVQAGNLRLVELLLGVVYDIDVPGPNDRTALHLATMECLPNIAKLLIDHGASPLKKDRNNMTPIGLASSNGSVAILDIFLSSPSSFSTLELLHSTCAINDSSLLHLAVESGSSETIAYLLHKNINKRCMDAEGFTALHVAGRMGQLSIMWQLIESDRWLLNAPSHHGITPLHEAAKHDQVMAVNCLLAKGASPDVFTSNGASPLLFAASFGAHKTIQECLKICYNVNYLERDEGGMSVLHCAVGHTETLQVLAKALKDRPGFEDLVSAPDNNGATALHYASHDGHLSDVILLVKHGARLDAVDSNGATPLHFAAKGGHLRIAAWLSSRAPRLLNTVDNCGRTSLHIACLYGHSKTLRKLLLSGSILMSDCNGRTPFHCAAWNGSIESLKALFSAFPDDVNSTDNEKATALHMAVAANHPGVVTFLLDQGALITDNELGLNCLDIAVANKLEGCASAVVSHHRWRESMKPIASCPTAVTQLELLVQKMPEQALVIMDKCVELPQENSGAKQSYDFRYLLGVTDQQDQLQPRAPCQLLKAMLKPNRSSCLAHPLCVEFLNTMWKKFVAAVVVLNIALYACFLFLLTLMAVDFPAYSLHPVEHEDSIKRLLNVLLHAQRHNRRTLNAAEKFEFCYGNAELRWPVIIAAVICLIKELLPVWYKGVEYFKKVANVCELVVYSLTLFFLDPFGFFLKQSAIPQDSCPKIVWELAAVTVVLGWSVLNWNFQRLPHIGMYIVMIESMIKTMIQVVIVASLYIVGFGLAFHMLESNEDQFSTGGLSLMRVVTMTLGDLSYDDILPISQTQESANLNSYYDQLRNLSGHFSFINSLLLPRLNETVYTTVSTNCSISGTTSSSDTACEADVPLLISPYLSYLVFICFVLLMPIVVLNVLIGLAVGDIEAVRAHAAVRKIRMQMELLVELEAALPAWFLNRVHVLNSCHIPKKESYLRGMLRSATNAAEATTGKEKSTAAIQLTEVKHNIEEVKEWLNNIEHGLEKQLVMLKTFATCVKCMPRVASQDAVEQGSCINAVMPVDVSNGKD